MYRKFKFRIKYGDKDSDKVYTATETNRGRYEINWVNEHGKECSMWYAREEVMKCIQKDEIWEIKEILEP